MNEEDPQMTMTERFKAPDSLANEGWKMQSAIREMDDALRHRMDIANAHLKEISRWCHWCAVAAMVYLLWSVIQLFK